MTTRIDNQYYDVVGDGWWDPAGPLGVLHSMNPARISYCDGILSGLGARAEEIRVVDVGCGGGLVSERLASYGYRVTGVDLSPGTVETARKHAEWAHVEVDYQVGSAYDLPMEDGSVDAVVMSDVLEHFDDVPRALAEAARVLRPGGMLIYDTVNRTIRSYLVAILLAERVLKIVHPNTHDWRMFIRPPEARALLTAAGLKPAQMRGLTPSRSLLGQISAFARTRRVGSFRVGGGLGVSYIGHAVKTR
ncbi:bifunctional 2-polyprenyl-6-hydroxyphenol methylase/3-demethylubiquinol 3-O-methyltransferase UbiG [Microbispora sp. NPDC049125]|uniref:bifunctional 2-polyprenyl-6-hydroxyphenol methylase/3-demethylubiquinol 3-O-methyltransferase UbiG n=1 Tax=Microbispora sp. NPDC049125 TaxID=3154929 RepID=UPI0034673723